MSQYQTLDCVAPGQFSIYDTWNELLAGTRFLLDTIDDRNCDNICRQNRLRLVLISSPQMVEVMLFQVISNSVKDETKSCKHLERLYNYDLKKKIKFHVAANKWPQILDKGKFDFKSEQMKSMNELFILRNAAIHHLAKSQSIEIAEIAAYTAVESSKQIYNHFNDNKWDSSHYKTFLDRHKIKPTDLLQKYFKDGEIIDLKADSQKITRK